MNLRLLFRRLKGLIARIFYPRYSTCGRCGRPWSICEDHTTIFEKEDGSPHRGCFPLCEDCWRELSPEERLPYYRELYDLWIRQGSKADWSMIKKAVLEEDELTTL